MEESDYVGSQDASPKKKKKKNKKTKRNLGTDFDEVDTSFNQTQELDEEEPTPPPSAGKQKKKKSKVTLRKDQDSDSDSDEPGHRLVSPKKESASPKKKKPVKSPEPLVEANGDDEEAAHDSVPMDGLAIVANMSQDDIELLLNKVEAQCPIDDSKKIMTRGSLIVWDDVSFSCYGPHQCKLAWEALMAQTRKYRIMYELVQEVKYNLKVGMDKFIKKAIKSAPDYPKHPYASGGFQVYCKEKWEEHKSLQGALNKNIDNFIAFQKKCHTQWKALKPEQQKVYDQKVQLLTAEYQQRVREFYAKYPNVEPPQRKLNKDGKPEPKEKLPSMKAILKACEDMFPDAPKPPLSPMQLFVQHKLKRVQPADGEEILPEEQVSLKAHYVQNWKELSADKKLKWINKCVKYWERFHIELMEFKRQNPLFLLSKETQLSKVISKEELGIWMKDHGMPPTPKNTVFDYFAVELRSSPEAADIPEDSFMKVAAEKWKALPNRERERYTLGFRMQKLDFKVELEKYLETVPTVLKSCVIESLPKGIKKQYMEEVGKQNMVDEDEELEVKSGAKGKRKLESDAESGTPSKKKKKQDGDETELPLYIDSMSEETLRSIKQQYKQVAEPNTAKQKSAYGRTPSKAVIPVKNIAPRILTETIRGIFDGRQHERSFSVYYYYAKYVAREKCWAKSYTERGIFETATRMIETFFRLPKQEQQVFIEEAQKFHTHRYYYRQIAQEDDYGTADIRLYPEEPNPPPRKASLLYQVDVKKQKLNEGRQAGPCVPWEQLDDKVKLSYMRKLFEMTRDYVREYDRFVRNMTPNDMVEYIVRKSMDWEQRERRYGCNYEDNVIFSVANAVEIPSSSTTYTLGLSGDCQAVEPNILSSDMEIYARANLASSTCRYKNNPFARNSRKQKSLVSKICSQESAANKLTTRDDSDFPSSTEDEDEEAYGKTQRTKKEKERDLAFRRKLRALQRYPAVNLTDLEPCNGPENEILPTRHLQYREGWGNVRKLVNSVQKVTEKVTKRFTRSGLRSQGRNNKKQARKVVPRRGKKSENLGIENESEPEASAALELDSDSDTSLEESPIKQPTLGLVAPENSTPRKTPARKAKKSAVATRSSPRGLPRCDPDPIEIGTSPGNKESEDGFSILDSPIAGYSGAAMFSIREIASIDDNDDM